MWGIWCLCTQCGMCEEFHWKGMLWCLHAGIDPLDWVVAGDWLNVVVSIWDLSESCQYPAGYTTYVGSLQLAAAAAWREERPYMTHNVNFKGTLKRLWIVWRRCTENRFVHWDSWCGFQHVCLFVYLYKLQCRGSTWYSEEVRRKLLLGYSGLVQGYGPIQKAAILYKVSRWEI